MIDEQSRQLAADYHVRHCDAEDRHDPAHVCQGKITINAMACTFECARCGEDRINIAMNVAMIRAAEHERRMELEAFNKDLIERIEKDFRPLNAEPAT